MYMIQTLNADGSHMGQVILNSEAEMLLAIYNFGAANQKIKLFKLDAEVVALG